MRYQYIATTRSGSIQRGTLEASSKEEVVKNLQARKLMIISIHQEKKIAVTTKSILGGLRLGHIPMLDKVIFARHLAIMIRSGLSLTEALDIIQEQASSKKLKRITQSVLESVNNGQTLAASLSRFPKVFSGVFIGMVKVGEASGTLEQNLDHVATELEKDYELRRKVKSAMIYPAIVLAATFILGIGLTIFILPKLVKMFDTFKVELPVVTRIFLDIANLLVDYGLYVLVGLVILGVLLRLLVKSKAARPFFHKIYLHLPIVKKISKNVNLARLARVLAILLKSGVTINESLVITADVVGNVLYKRELGKAITEIKKGRSLALSMTNEEYIPKMANKMIAVGEKTGKLEESLFYLAGFYEEEVDNTTKNLSTILEPALLIIIGLVLGFLAVAIISPIYQFTGSLSR